MVLLNCPGKQCTRVVSSAVQTLTVEKPRPEGSDQGDTPEDLKLREGD